MDNTDFDNIPILDELIEKGSAESTIQSDLEPMIHAILQRHTSQAVEEILAIINSNKNKVS